MCSQIVTTGKKYHMRQQASICTILFKGKAYKLSSLVEAIELFASCSSYNLTSVFCKLYIHNVWIVLYLKRYSSLQEQAFNDLEICLWYIHINKISILQADNAFDTCRRETLQKRCLLRQMQELLYLYLQDCKQKMRRLFS